MEILTGERSTLRGAVTKASTELDALFKQENPEVDQIRIKFRIFDDKCTRLFKMDERMEDVRIQAALEAAKSGTVETPKSTPKDDEKPDKSRERIEHYREMHCTMSLRYEDFINSHYASSNAPESELDRQSHVTDSVEKTTKLPRLTLVEFDGDLRNWLKFWNSFQKIDKDPTLSNDSKVSYLLQSMKPGSIAMEVMEIFPTSGDHYEEAKDYLQSTFGNESLLIEMHSRDILTLAFSRVLNRTPEFSLRSLLYKLQAQIRALEQLGFKREHAGFLYPIVEATLPDELLRKWGSSKDNPGNASVLRFQLGSGPPPPPKDSYDKLEAFLSFLQLEVQGEARLEHSKVLTNLADSTPTGRSPNNRSTASALAATGSPSSPASTGPVCIFCRGRHNSQDCVKAAKMSYDERTKFLSDNKYCFRCLKQGHNVRQRKCGRITICCPICTKSHYALLCKQDNGADRTTTPPVPGNRDRQPARRSNDNFSGSSIIPDGLSLQQTLRVRVTQGNRSLILRVFLDEGSERSYILSKRASELGLRSTGTETLRHCVFGGAEWDEITHDIFQVTLRSLNNNYKISLPLLGQAKICGPVSRLPSSSSCLQQLQRFGISLTDYGDDPPAEIAILLGGDTLPRIYTGTSKKISDYLLARETFFGWTLLGKGNSTNPSCRSYVCTSRQLADLGALDDKLPDLWDLDCLGVRDPYEVQSAAEKQAAVLQDFENNLHVDEHGRYEVRLPWRDFRTGLDSNQNVAYQRLLTTTKNLLRDNRFEDYNKILEDWERDGIIEVVDPHAVSPDSVHYLPHRGVYRSSSESTKLRPVFDASCMDRHKNCLNSCLETGPNMIELIPDILTRFRLGKIGFSADISKAFLQIAVTQEDRDMLRFLWWSDYETRTLKTYRHCRVVFGLKSSPFLLAATLQHHFHADHPYYQETIATLSDSFYVDDLAGSKNTVQEYHAFREESKAILKSAKFDLAKWKTNAFPPENDVDAVTRILGLQWNLKTDTLSCATPDVTVVQEVTKRVALSIANSLYDPLGLISPGTLLPRLLIQQAWQHHLGWDEPLTSELHQQFLKWAKTIHFFSQCQIPRFLGATPTVDNSTLHVFCDASKDAYAACAFIRIDVQGEIVVQLLRSSNRVTSLKKAKTKNATDTWVRPTIPRLELLAALIGARLASTVLKSIKLQIPVTYWSDSTTVLCWIKCYRPWSVFVQNRVEEIRTSSDPTSWHHVPGHMNPADLPSRGCDAFQLHTEKWWEGPDWLRESPENWPAGNNDFSNSSPEIDHELRKTVQTLVTVPHVVVNDPVIDFLTERCLFFTRIVNAKAWYNRAVDTFLHSVDRMPFARIQTPLHPQEIKWAEIDVIRYMQSQLTGLQLSKFSTFIDKHGLIRIKSRILTGTIDEFLNPFLLPQCLQTKRIIFELHLKCKHAGPQTLLSLLRERFWVINARRLVKQIVRDCKICRRHSAKAATTPPAPLPAERTTMGPVFHTTGVDLAGPLYLRDASKVWVVLFTCAVYRAVHLELVTSQSTECFNMALRRFISRRGRMNGVLSDHGGNFEGTARLLASIDVEKLPNRLQWTFIPPKAPWWGGFWERLVKSLKDLLKRNLGHASLDYEELSTLICEIENILNSRPLTYLSADNDDLQPLTPAHFLRDIADGSTPDLDIIDDQQIRTRGHHLNQIRRGLRERFRREYLALLVYTRRDEQPLRPLHPGDIVLIESETKKRIDWRLGRILRTFPGVDGAHRVAEVKTAKRTLLRPFQKLYPLEISQVSPLISGTVSDDTPTASVSQKEIRTDDISVSSDQDQQPDKVKDSSPVQTPPENPPVVTRAGRLVKAPTKLDLFLNSPLLKVNDFFVY